MALNYQVLYGFTFLIMLVGAIVNSFTFVISTVWADYVVPAMSINIALMAFSFLAGHLIWKLFQGNRIYQALSVLFSIIYFIALGFTYLIFAMKFSEQGLSDIAAIIWTLQESFPVDANWALSVVGLIFCVLALIAGMANRSLECGYSNAFRRHQSAQTRLNISIEHHANVIRKYIEPYLAAPNKQYKHLCQMINEYAEQVTAERMTINWYSQIIEEINDSYHYSIRKFRHKIEELSNDSAPAYSSNIEKPFDAKELLVQMNYPRVLEEKEQRVQSFEEMKSQLREQLVNVKHKLYDLRQSAIQKAVDNQPANGEA